MYEELGGTVYKAQLMTELKPYLEAARTWWNDIDKFIPRATGVTKMNNAPNGMSIRFTRSPIKSPIRGVQAFPFVPSAYLTLDKVTGGVRKMVDMVCRNGLVIDEFTVITKVGLPSTYQQGQILCFIPTYMLGEENDIRWIVMNKDELMAAKCGVILDTVKAKCDNALYNMM